MIRYHPAIIAQAVATIVVMSEGQLHVERRRGREPQRARRRAWLAGVARDWAMRFRFGLAGWKVMV